MAQEPCVECGKMAMLKGKGHCRSCFQKVTFPCNGGCLRRIYEVRGVCEACAGKGLEECQRCYKWRKPYMNQHCRECVKVVKFDCTHSHGVQYRGKCVSCFVEQAHTVSKVDKNNGVGSCRFCGKVSVNVKTSGATCQQWTNFLTRARNYGLSAEDLRDMYVKSQGSCGICGQPEGTVTFAIDHDHACCNTSRSCGKCVRNLLCKACNTALGQVSDSITVLEWAIQYLKDPHWRDLPLED